MNTCTAIVWIESRNGLADLEPSRPADCGRPATTTSAVGPRCEEHLYIAAIPHGFDPENIEGE